MYFLYQKFFTEIIRNALIEKKEKKQLKKRILERLFSLGNNNITSHERKQMAATEIIVVNRYIECYS
jgi:hypothetical protein